MSRTKRLASFASLAAAAFALSACQTVGNMFGGGDDTPSAANAAPQDGRISILAFEQQLAPDPALAGRAIVTPPAVPVGEWTQPGGTADNSPPHSSGAAVLERAWRANLGAGSNNRVQLAAPPVIADGRLYFLDAAQRVHAIGARDGERAWNASVRGENGDRNARGGGLAVSGGRVFVTTGHGELVALDGSSGAEVWRVAAGAPFHSAPTVAGGRVYAITNDSELMAFDAGNGEVQWTFQAIAETARILSAPSVAIDGETVVAPFASGEVVAFLTANGRRLWADSLSRTSSLTSLSAINDIAGRPVIDNGVAFAVRHSGLIAAIDVRSGQRIWSRGFASTQTPWIAGDVLYAVSVDGELAAFDRTSGAVYWVSQLRRYRNENSREGRLSWTGPIMVGGRLVLANSVGDVIGVSPQNGEVIARADVGDPVFVPPIAANDQIYVVTNKAQLHVLR